MQFQILLCKPEDDQTSAEPQVLRAADGMLHEGQLCLARRQRRLKVAIAWVRRSLPLSPSLFRGLSIPFGALLAIFLRACQNAHMSAISALWYGFICWTAPPSVLLHRTG